MRFRCPYCKKIFERGRNDPMDFDKDRNLIAYCDEKYSKEGTGRVLCKKIRRKK